MHKSRDILIYGRNIKLKLALGVGMKIYKISKVENEYTVSQMNCGGYKSPKSHSHLDTQMFPDCPNRSLSTQKDKKKDHKCTCKKCTCKK